MMLVRKFMTRTLQYLDSLQWCDARCATPPSVRSVILSLCGSFYRG